MYPLLLVAQVQQIFNKEEREKFLSIIDAINNDSLEPNIEERKYTPCLWIIDFSAISLTVIGINMFVNANGITFTKRVLEDGYVQYCVDVNRSIFAVRSCKENEFRAVRFSPPRNRQLLSTATAELSLR